MGVAGTTQVYKCFDQSLNVLYTDEPCKDAEKLSIRGGDADPAAVAWLQRQRDLLDQSAAARIADERRAALQERFVARPAYLPDEALGVYGDGAAYVPYGYGFLSTYPYTGRHAPGARPPRRVERRQYAVPVSPRTTPRL